MARWRIAGAWMLAGAGAVWGAGAVAYADRAEAPKCLLLAAGFALAAWGFGSTRGNLLVPVGLAVAALPASSWMVDALVHGHPASAWVLLGVGVDLALLVALVRAPRSSARLAFALVAAAGALMLVRDPSVAVWSLAPLLALGGGVLVALDPGVRSPRPG